MQERYHYTNALWRRLKKNKAALASLSFILLLIFIALFAYLLAPDHTPFADRQMVELQARKPGYSQLFLSIPKNDQVKEVSFFERLVKGSNDRSLYLPINSHHEIGDTLEVQLYVDEDTSLLQRYSIAEITQGHPDHLPNHFITRKYWLGTDVLGRDMLSRLMVGARVSLTVGILAALISLCIGTFLGAIAGYFGGFADKLIMWILNVTWSIPTVLLVFACTVALGKGFWQIFLAMGLTMWVNVARMVRGQVLVIRELDYIQAAKSMGFSHGRILFRHILPNLSGPLMVLAASNFATAIMLEAGLSFLGLGIQPPHPSWGLMMRENYHFIITNNAVLALVPGIAIFLLVMAFNVLANEMRQLTIEN